MATTTADIVGHSCYDDLATGASQESSASNFDALPRPASVLVRGDAEELIKRAETSDDVYARDTIPARLRRPTAAST